MGLAEAAEAEDDGDHDQGGQHHVQHQVEVGVMEQAAHLNTVTLRSIYGSIPQMSIYYIPTEHSSGSR